MNVAVVGITLSGNMGCQIMLLSTISKLKSLAS